MLFSRVLVTLYHLEGWLDIRHLDPLSRADELVVWRCLTTRSERRAAVPWFMLFSSFLQAALGSPQFVDRVLSHLRRHGFKIVTSRQGAPRDRVLTAEGAGEHGYLDSPLLIALLISLLEVLSHLLLGVLEPLVYLLSVRCILLDIAKTLIAWAYHILARLEPAVTIRLLLIIVMLSLQKIQLFQLRIQVFYEEIYLVQY